MNPLTRKRLIFNILALLHLVTASWAQSDNKSRITPDSIKTEHGYIVLNHTNKPGPKPAAGDKVAVHVSLWIGDSLLQDTRQLSLEPTPIQLPDLRKEPAGRKVPAIFDGIALAAKGDSISIFQPIDSSFTARLPINSMYKNEKWIHLELVTFDIITAAAMKKMQKDALNRLPQIQRETESIITRYRNNQLASQIAELPSGLKILIVDKGSGSPLELRRQVKTHYYGCMNTGKMFDNSFRRGEPIAFTLGAGQMIPGLDEGIQQLNHGGKAYIFIPPNLNYGDTVEPGGPIAANTELIFYVEVE